MFRIRLYFFTILLFLFACTPELPNASTINSVTAIPTTDDAVLCAIGQDNIVDWATRLEALRTLHDRFADCDTDIDLLLYMSYAELGNFMERAGDANAAISAYNNALFYYSEGTHAQNRLSLLQSREATEEASVCENGETSEPLPDYSPSNQPFMGLNDSHFQLNDSLFPIYGVNYYPMNSPFERFLTETDLEDVEFEFALIRESGINTLRIFLRPEDLFICNAPIPNNENFERLDAIIQLASEADLRLIVTLNQDIVPSVLYFEPFIREQMRFIVERYRDEATIIAWDVRDKGDLDYRNGLIRQDIALHWLADTVVMLRQIDTQHPVTVGWWQDSEISAPLVDFVSFQSYGDYTDLQQNIANLNANTNRPILLISTGYSTFTVSEINQRNFLYQTFEETQNNNLMGWMVNHTFDYPRTVTCTPPNCPSIGDELNQFGLWNTGYFPKLAVDAIRIITGVDE
ncbi:MAG: hypothetical protein Phog2KO_22560 [Phototrophicaceae bacterium]